MRRTISTRPTLIYRYLIYFVKKEVHVACVLCSIKKRLHDFQSDVQLIQESGGLSDLVSQKLEVLYQDTKNILDQTEDNTLDRSRLANFINNKPKSGSDRRRAGDEIWITGGNFRYIGP